MEDCNAYKIIVGTDTPYAEIHNEGGHINKTVQVRGHYRHSFKKTKKGTGIWSLKSKRERKKTVRLQTGRRFVRGHKRKMNTRIPQRKFIGVSAILERRIERALDKLFTESLK